MIVIFDSTYSVIQSEQILKKQKIFCETIPIPREISSDCGAAIKIKPEDKIKVEEVLAHNKNIIIKKIIESGKNAI